MVGNVDLTTGVSFAVSGVMEPVFAYVWKKVKRWPRVIGKRLVTMHRKKGKTTTTSQSEVNG